MFLCAGQGKPRCLCCKGCFPHGWEGEGDRAVHAALQGAGRAGFSFPRLADHVSSIPSHMGSQVASPEGRDCPCGKCSWEGRGELSWEGASILAGQGGI